MNRFATSILSSICLSLLAAATTAATLDDPALIEAYIDGVVMPLMLNNNSPSGTIAISHGGEVIFAKGYGYENIEDRVPVDPGNTLFRPGSVSKLFTWVSVMQLVEQGKLDLDTDVNEYLESFSIKETFAEPITLRHILTHTPGFEDGGLGYLIIDDPANVISLREAMERYQPERVNPPGKQTAYSNYATALAGLIVENVSGVPFNDYVQQNIFDPLQMMSSSFVEPLPDALADRMATSYGVEAGAFKKKAFEIVANFGPAGALSATATDMLRFAQAIINGGELDGNRILEEATVKQMLTRSFSHDDRLFGMLLGFYETDYNGHRVVGHGGDTQWFHSDLAIDVDNDLALFVSFGGPGGRVPRSAVITGFYNEFFPTADEPPVPPEDFMARATRYAGSYAFWRGNFSKIERVFGMGSVVQVAPTEDNTLLVAFGGGAKQYIEVEDNLFRERHAGVSLVAGISPHQIAFQEDANGSITGFVMDGLPFMSLRKLPAYATPNFNFSLLGLSVLVLLGVVLRRFFQRREIAAMVKPDRAAVGAAFYAAAAHIAVLVLGVVVVSIVMQDLINGFPPLFKAWLVLPILAVIVTVYLVLKTTSVWRDSLFGGVWARMRYTVVTLAAVFMSWFYWYWNILGFQYL